MAQLESKAAVVLIGKEGVGKSRLVASLTGRLAYSSNFRGSTIYCDTYDTPEISFVDTPGIQRHSDSETTAAALEQLVQRDVVMLVIQATHIDSDLKDLLPLVQGKRGIVVVTHWDRISITNHDTSLGDFSKKCDIEFVPVDARHLSENQKARIMAGLARPATFPARLATCVGWQVEPRPTLLERRYVGQMLALLLILLPSIAAVVAANTFAAFVEVPIKEEILNPAAVVFSSLPLPLRTVFVGDYGFVTMGPLLFVWAVPTIAIYSLLLGVYKASGLLERISSVMHPLLRPLGLSGRDLVRVIMGFGCNVPAVLSTRACSSCSRGTAISAIAFGSACSYQFGATIAVFSAAKQAWLVVPFLLFLSATTLAYTRLVSSKAGRSKLNVLMSDGRTFIERPTLAAVWSESKMALYQFFRLAIPIFFAITIAASLLDWAGVIDALAGLMGPVMAVFGLPSKAAVSVVFGSIRKDGLLLLADPNLVSTLSPLQLLTGVYIAGVLLPCLVTLLTIVRERNWLFAAKMVGKQAAAAILFTLLLAWVGRLFFP